MLYRKKMCMLIEKKKWKLGKFSGGWSEEVVG